MDGKQLSGSAAEAAGRFTRFHETPHRKWWVNLTQVAAARLCEETVRGYGGEARRDVVLTLYVHIATPIGEAMCVKVYGAEAEAVAARLDEMIPAALSAQTRAA